MIKQAIIPLAGLGTRLLPLTSVLPKELLPINGKPGLEYVLDECIQAGIKEIILIISSKKQIIKKYFYNDTFFKKIIKRRKDDKKLKFEYSKIKKYKKMIKFVYQDNPIGTGDAVLKCKKYIKSNYFLMLLPDDLIVKKVQSGEIKRADMIRDDLPVIANAPPKLVQKFVQGELDFDQASLLLSY